MDDLLDDAISQDDVLEIVRRRSASSFFVIDTMGRVLLEDCNVCRLPVAVARLAGEMARNTSPLANTTAIVELAESYVIRMVELGGVTGRFRGVFVDTLRERSEPVTSS